MIDLRTQVEDRLKRVEKAEQIASGKNVRRLVATIRKDIIAHVKVNKIVTGYMNVGGKRIPIYRPAPKGEPVASHRSKAFWRGGLRFYADNKTAYGMVGPISSRMGDVMRGHEFGGNFRGRRFDKRPTIGPGLTRNIDLVPREWAGTIGG